MFVCQVTGKLSKPGEKLERIIARRRQRLYLQHQRDEETGVWVEVEVGRGWEIVRELRATPEGVSEWEHMSDAQREEHLRHV